MLNEAYERARLDLRLDHRSCKEREAEARAWGNTIEADRWVREATEHMGPTLTQADRKAARQAAPRDTSGHARGRPGDRARSGEPPTPCGEPGTGGRLPGD